MRNQGQAVELKREPKAAWHKPIVEEMQTRDLRSGTSTFSNEGTTGVAITYAPS